MKENYRKYSNFSRPDLKSEDSGSVNSFEVISKYFVRTTKLENNRSNRTTVVNSTPENGNESLEIECPYASDITEVCDVHPETSTADESDFKTPKPSTKRTIKLPNKKRTNRIPLKKKSRQTILSKTFINVGRSCNVNPEHLQLAVALSKSEQDANVTDAIDSSKAVIAPTLEHFGFTSGQRHYPLLRKTNKKKSKFKFITPVLNLRTESERLQRISEKVSTILNENCFTWASHNLNEKVVHLLSSTLTQYWNKSSDIFEMSRKNFTETHSNQIFYVKTITSISQSNLQCGTLLRDWKTIPGRPLSPIEQKCAQISTVTENKYLQGTGPILTASEDSNSYRCDSPNLFGSDDDTLLDNSLPFFTCAKFNKIIIDENDCNLYSNTASDIPKYTSNTSPEITETINSQNADNHFTSNEDIIMDLTQSSDDEMSTPRLTNIEGAALSTKREKENVTEHIYSVLNHMPKEDDESIYLTQHSPDSFHDRDQHTSNNIRETFISALQSSSSIVISDNECDIQNSDDDNTNSCSSKTDLPLPNLVKVDDACVTSFPATPKRKVIIKTDNITPMLNYDSMSTPNIQKELEKFGVKPFKRLKAVKILQHIYDKTHPIGHSMSMSDDEDSRTQHKRKIDTSPKKKRSIKKHKSEPCFQTSKTEHINRLEDLPENEIGTSFNFIGNYPIEILENVDVDTDELVFETLYSKKRASCRVPFHIVFHNLVSANPKLREQILLYEPFKLVDLHKALNELGYKFGIKDIENFLHRKCIAIRIKQGHDFKMQKRK